MKLVFVLICLLAMVIACSQEVTKQATPAPLATATVAPVPTATRAASNTIASTSVATLQASASAISLRPTSTPPSPCRFQFETDLAFVDITRGWLLWYAHPANESLAALYSTTNGGETWRSVAIPQASIGWCGEMIRPPRVSEVRFVTASDGWLAVPDYFVTHDGGITWSQESRQVWALEVKDGTVWSIEGTCRDSNTCGLMLRSSSDNGMTWQRIGTVPSEVGPLGLTLIRGTAQDAWILGGQEGVVEPTLLATRDSGKSWQSVIDPCPRWRHTISSARARQLWLVCSGSPATIMEDKQVYVSDDGGEHWQLRADTCYQNCRFNNIDSTGHVRDIALPEAQRAIIALGRSTLLATKDGGHTWNQVIEFSRGSGADSGMFRVLFVDELHGWAVGGLRRVFRTRNGGDDWEDFPLPGTQ